MNRVWPRVNPERPPGQIKIDPQDFKVDEVLEPELESPGGISDGEFCWVRIEKTGCNTAWVADQLARFAKVKPAAVSFSGMKDRQAVTTQWFSIHLPGQDSPDFGAWDHADVRVLEIGRGRRKLRRGSHTANRFRIVVRETDVDAVRAGVQRHEHCGFPNYFGEQRFGRDRSNLDLARRMVDGRRLKRHQRSLAISTMRSWVFNEILAARVEANTWNTLLVGDLAMLSGSQSYFEVDDVDAELEQRAAAGDLAPTGLLLGDGQCLPAEEPAVKRYADWQQWLSKNRVNADRRRLVLRPRDFACQVLEESVVELSFELERGAFATAVLEELVQLPE